MAYGGRVPFVLRFDMMIQRGKEFMQPLLDIGKDLSKSPSIDELKLLLNYYLHTPFYSYRRVYRRVFSIAFWLLFNSLLIKIILYFLGSILHNNYFACRFANCPVKKQKEGFNYWLFWFNWRLFLLFNYFSSPCVFIKRLFIFQPAYLVSVFFKIVEGMFCTPQRENSKCFITSLRF